MKSNNAKLKRQTKAKINALEKALGAKPDVNDSRWSRWYFDKKEIDDLKKQLEKMR